ncbi:MAG: outer membrane beta-barrel protein [Bacteroidia bacterium]|nr:outer membrane beta-barrel protein [Bacteroidia bacterium]
MKKIILIVLLALTANVVLAQKNIKIGPYYIFGTSTIVSSGNAMGMNNSGMNHTNTNSDISFKLSFGTGLRAELSLNKNWGLYVQTGYQQRGGKFNNYMDTYKPRYNLNYWDVNMGGQYKITGGTKRKQLVINLGLTQHTLLNANRAYDMGSDNMNGDFGNLDVGLFFGIGGNFPVFEKDIFQIQLFANQGFSQMYSGNMLMNNWSGRNMLMGIQIGYLIGKSIKINTQ